MKPKVSKITDADFAGLLPASNIPASEMPSDPPTEAEPTSIAERIDSEVSAKSSKGKKSKPTSGISIRLTFSTQDYKSLSLLAFNESDKIGKRVSVTNLLLTQANKLIKKGNTNA